MSRKNRDFLPAVDHNEYGLLQDASRFRKCIGSTAWESLRYFETAVEVLAPSKFAHRHVLINETHLFVFGLGDKNVNAWKGEAAHRPISLKNIIRLEHPALAVDIFSEHSLNKNLRPIRITYLEKSKKNEVELVAWEKQSGLRFHIESAWNNLLTRLCQGYCITMPTNEQDAKVEILSLFEDVDLEIRSSKQIGAKCKLLDELSEAIFTDRDLKECFFKIPSLRNHVFKELQNCASMSNSTVFSSKNSRKEETEREKNVKRLKYVSSLLNLLRSVLFNSEMVPSRTALLHAQLFSFSEIADTCTLCYSKAYLESRDKEEGESDSENSYSDEGEQSDEAIEPYEKEMLIEILDQQVQVLLGLESIINLAIFTGTTNTLVSQTLGNTLAKNGYNFLYSWLPRFLRNLVKLMTEWSEITGKEDADIDTEQDEMEERLGALSVKIFQHSKLYYRLIIADYQIRESILQNNAEELQYYLSKPEFLNKLNTGHQTLFSRLNHQSSEMIRAVNQAFEDLNTNTARTNVKP